MTGGPPLVAVVPLAQISRALPLAQISGALPLAQISGADGFGLVVSVLVIAYLLYALLRGERF